MILETTATDVEIEFRGETLLFHDVEFFARLMVTHAAIIHNGVSEFPSEPSDCQVVTFSLKEPIRHLESRIIQCFLDAMPLWLFEDTLEPLGGFAVSDANVVAIYYIIKQSLTDRIHAGEWDDQIRNG